MTSHYAPWTAHDLRKLRTLYVHTVLTVAEIARMMHRTETAIRSQTQVMRIKRRKKAPRVTTPPDPRANALRQAARIRAYWQKQGERVTVVVEETPAGWTARIVDQVRAA